MSFNMIRKLTVLNRTLWKSLSSLSYYLDVVKSPFSFSAKYFTAFSLLLGTLLTVSISLSVLPSVNMVVSRLQKRAGSLYPPDLIIMVKNGNLSTNVTEPLRFSIPYELFTDTPPAVADDKQSYLLTIDTKGSINDFPKNRSAIFITKNQFAISDNQDGYRVYPLDEKTNTIINKAAVDKFLKQSLPLLTFLPFLLVVVLFVVFALFLPLTRLVTLLFLTLVLLVAVRLMRLSLGFAKLYQIGLHALTLPTLVQIGMVAFDIAPRIPFFNSILYLLYALVILSSLREKLGTEPVQPVS